MADHTPEWPAPRPRRVGVPHVRLLTREAREYFRAKMTAPIWNFSCTDGRCVGYGATVREACRNWSDMNSRLDDFHQRVRAGRI